MYQGMRMAGGRTGDVGVMSVVLCNRRLPIDFRFAPKEKREPVSDIDIAVAGTSSLIRSPRG